MGTSIVACILPPLSLSLSHNNLILSCKFYGEPRERLLNKLRNTANIEYSPNDHANQFITKIMESKNPH